METANQLTSSNDYAVARELNLLVMTMVMNVYLADNAGLSPNSEIEETNRAYILLVDELQKLYDNNPKLAAIEPGPIWKRFDVLKASTRQIIKHIADPDNDYGSAHYARVEKMCILANVETPHFTSEQKKVMDFANKITTEYYEKVQDAYKQKLAVKENDWQIPEYVLTFKLDGTILINGVLKLKRVHPSSITEKLLDQAIKNPNTPFKPAIGQTSRNLSTILSSAGFTQELRALFFPTTSKSKGVIFRPTVTRRQADDDNIDTSLLDLRLKELGAETEPKNS